MADSQPPRTTSSGLRGRRGLYDLNMPPPAAHVSFKPEMVGRRFGRVEIISPEKRWNAKMNHCYVLTRCTGCGATQWQNLGNLRIGRSMGCQSCSQPPQPYPHWLDRRLTTQKQRCTNPRDPGYPNYGGRGITFDFPSVRAGCLWVMENLGLPDKPMELDRVNNNLGYAPGNLRWATHKENNANRRNTRIIEWRTEDWPYSISVVRRKLAQGMTREEILDDAWLAVQEKRKNWRNIEKWFASTTYLTPDPDIALRFRESSSTTADTAGPSEL